MHRIVTKVKALLIRSGWAFAPSYISVESRNYSVIIVKAIQSSFPLDPAILNARIYLIYRIFIFVTRRGGKKIFYLSAIKVLARNLKYAVDFSLFFFCLQSTQLVAMRKIGRGIGSRSFHATSGTFSPVFLAHLSALTSWLVAALFLAHHRLEAAHVRMLSARNN